MVLGAYAPRWAKVDSGGETLRAVAFFVNRSHPTTPASSPRDRHQDSGERARAAGLAGRIPLETVHGLIEHGVRDPYLLELRKRVLAVHPELGATPARYPRGTNLKF